MNFMPKVTKMKESLSGLVHQAKGFLNEVKDELLLRIEQERDRKLSLFDELRDEIWKRYESYLALREADRNLVEEDVVLEYEDALKHLSKKELEEEMKLVNERIADYARRFSLKSKFKRRLHMK